MQNSSIISISGKNAPISLIFCMEIFTKKLASNPTFFCLGASKLTESHPDLLRLTLSVIVWSGRSIKNSWRDLNKDNSERKIKQFFLKRYINLQISDQNLLLSIQIPRFSDHQNLLSEIINILDFFLRRYGYQEKITSKNTTVGWLGPGAPNHAQA